MDSEEIIDNIIKKTTFNRDEIKQKIERKQKELGGLVSEEGAAHLVAKEYGLDLISSNIKRTLQIKNIVGGMKNVTFSGRVFRISNIVEFKRADGSSGRVVNIFFGDRSGFCKVAFWDDQVRLVEEESVKIGDAIRIIGGIAKENIYGDIEVSLGKFGKIVAAEDIDLPSSEELAKIIGGSAYQRANIKNILPGNFEVKATVVDVLKGNFIFSVCHVCGKKVAITDGQAKCVEHGDVDTSNAVVINAIVDDGTGDLRAIFFREKAEKFVEIKAEELSQMNSEQRHEIIKQKVLGKELLLVGKVKNNKVFNRLEILVDEVKEINPLEESKRIAEEIELKLSM